MTFQGHPGWCTIRDDSHFHLLSQNLTTSCHLHSHPWPRLPPLPGSSPTPASVVHHECGNQSDSIHSQILSRSAANAPTAPHPVCGDKSQSPGPTRNQRAARSVCPRPFLTPSLPNLIGHSPLLTNSASRESLNTTSQASPAPGPCTYHPRSPACLPQEFPREVHSPHCLPVSAQVSLYQ